MAQRKDGGTDLDWVDRVTRLAASFGLNEVRVRWKLEAFRKRARTVRFRAGERAEQVRYRHKICPACGRLNDGEASDCGRCGARLGARGWHVLHRLGLGLPSFLSVSSLLGTAFVVVYGRLLLAAPPGDGILSLDVSTLLRFGGNWAPAVLGGGELWRLGTAIFLHAGLWHIGFNLLALSQVGPAVEETFGRGRMLFFFMMTGLVASAGSALASGPLPALLAGGVRSGLAGGVSIGASGAIMGLIGMTAGWGQRDGTAFGRRIRNQMLKWCAYTLIFGFFIRADNVAHVVGFLAGGAVGLATRPSSLVRSSSLPLAVTQAVVGVAAAAAAVLLCLLPPDSPATGALERQARIVRGEVPFEAEAARICALTRDGRLDLPWHARTLPLVGTTRETRRRHLAVFCETIAETVPLCERYREGGLEAVLGGEALSELPEESRRELEERHGRACATRPVAADPPVRAREENDAGAADGAGSDASDAAGLEDAAAFGSVGR